VSAGVKSTTNERDARHDEVAKVIRVAREAPPARGQELGAALCLHRGQACGMMITSVSGGQDGSRMRECAPLGFLPLRKSFFSPLEARKM